MKTVVFFTTLTFFFIAGCAPSTFDAVPKNEPFVPADQSFQSLQRHSNASPDDRAAKIGFIEFDDLGFQKDSEAVENVLNGIEALNSDPLLIVVFIHGWHHNAHPEDSNVRSFKEFLANIQYEEDNVSFARNKRQVVGVYVGWRGESNDTKLNVLTYRSRKAAGLRVGQYGLQEVLADLHKIRKSNPANRLVSIGHSFGGGVLYSSVMQNLVDDVVAAKVDSNGALGRIEKAYGDLVILMNPALEAARLEVLNRRLSNVEFEKCQPLVMASFTSEYDKALSDIFPKGQKLFFFDDRKVAVGSGNTHLVTTTYGNEPSYRTHQLSCDSCSYRTEPVYLTRELFNSAFEKWDEFRRNEGAGFDVGNIRLTHFEDSNINPGTPILNVFVKGNNLIKDHNAIWGSDFSLFARALIGMEFASMSRCRN